MVGCDNTPKKQTENTSAEKVTLTDMAGRKVLVPKSISKAFIDRSSVHLVYALDTLLPVKRFLRRKTLRNGYAYWRDYKATAWGDTANGITTNRSRTN